MGYDHLKKLELKNKKLNKNSKLKKKKLNQTLKKSLKINSIF